MNDDGSEDISDPIALISFFLEGEPPADPFPVPGLDPTGGDPARLRDLKRA